MYWSAMRHHIPARILDANGVEYFDVVECNTVTGFIEQHVKDDKGECVVVDGEIACRIVVGMPPLVIVNL